MAASDDSSKVFLVLNGLPAPLKLKFQQKNPFRHLFTHIPFSQADGVVPEVYWNSVALDAACCPLDYGMLPGPQHIHQLQVCLPGGLSSPPAASAATAPPTPSSAGAGGGGAPAAPPPASRAEALTRSMQPSSLTDGTLTNSAVPNSVAPPPSVAAAAPRSPSPGARNNHNLAAATERLVEELQYAVRVHSESAMRLNEQLMTARRDLAEVTDVLTRENRKLQERVSELEQDCQKKDQQRQEQQQTANQSLEAHLASANNEREARKEEVESLHKLIQGLALEKDVLARRGEELSKTMLARDEEWASDMENFTEQIRKAQMRSAALEVRVGELTIVQKEFENLQMEQNRLQREVAKIPLLEQQLQQAAQDNDELQQSLIQANAAACAMQDSNEVREKQLQTELQAVMEERDHLKHELQQRTAELRSLEDNVNSRPSDAQLHAKIRDIMAQNQRLRNLIQQPSTAVSQRSLSPSLPPGISRATSSDATSRQSMPQQQQQVNGPRVIAEVLSPYAVGHYPQQHQQQQAPISPIGSHRGTPKAGSSSGGFSLSSPAEPVPEPASASALLVPKLSQRHVSPSQPDTTSSSQQQQQPMVVKRGEIRRESVRMWTDEMLQEDEVAAVAIQQQQQQQQQQYSYSQPKQGSPASGGMNPIYQTFQAAAGGEQQRSPRQRRAQSAVDLRNSPPTTAPLQPPSSSFSTRRPTATGIQLPPGTVATAPSQQQQLSAPASPPQVPTTRVIMAHPSDNSESLTTTPKGVPPLPKRAAQSMRFTPTSDSLPAQDTRRRHSAVATFTDGGDYPTKSPREATPVGRTTPMSMDGGAAQQDHHLMPPPATSEVAAASEIVIDPNSGVALVIQEEPVDDSVAADDGSRPSTTRSRQPEVEHRGTSFANARNSFVRRESEAAPNMDRRQSSRAPLQDPLLGRRIVVDDTHPVSAATFDSIPQLFATAAEIGDKNGALCFPASADGSIPSTVVPWRRYYKSAQQFAKALMAEGLHRGMVAIVGESCPESVLAFSGTTLAGCVAVPLHADLHEEDLLPMLKDVDAQILVVDSPKALVKYANCKSALHSLRRIVVCRGVIPPPLLDGNFIVTFEEFIAKSIATPSEELSNVLLSTEPQHCAAICFTSGSSQRPKGVMLSHDNLQFSAWSLLHTLGGPSSIASPTDPNIIRHISYSSLSDPTYLVLDIILPMLILVKFRGATLMTTYFTAAGTPTSLKSLMKTVRPTLFVAPPSSWERLLQLVPPALGSEEVCAFLGLNQAQYLLWGGASWPNAAKKATRYGLDLLEFYSSVETTGIALVSSKLRNGFGSCGGRLIGSDVRMFSHVPGRDEAGQGEVAFRGRHIMIGYHRFPSMTREVLLDDGWYVSGDVVRLDDGGLAYYIGRTEDFVIHDNTVVALRTIEDTMKSMCPFIGTIIAFGDSKRSKNVCLVGFRTKTDPETGLLTMQLDGEAATLNPTVSTTFSDARSDPVFAERLTRMITAYNSSDACVSPAHKIYRYGWFTVPPSYETSDMTVTGKLRRTFTAEKYATVLEQIFEGRRSRGRASSNEASPTAVEFV